MNEPRRDRAVRSRAHVTRAVVAALVLSSAARAQAPAALAQAPPEPVELSVQGLFGHDAFLGGGYSPVLIRARNRTTTALRGEVEVHVRAWDRMLSMHRASLDLPPREERTATLTVPVFEDGASVSVSYRVGGATLANSTVHAGAADLARPIVLLDEPPRLRASLTGLTMTVESGDLYATSREVTIPIGVVESDSRSGDLILPESALGWSNVLLVIGSIPSIARADVTELRALEKWLHAGGNLVLMPGLEADLGHPFVRRIAGDLRRATSSGPCPLARARGTHEPPLDCPASAIREAFGCRVDVGHGAVWVTDLDLSDAEGSLRPETREVIAEIARSLTSFGSPPRPLLPLGRGPDRILAWWESGPNFAYLQAALDPNESYRPALVLVGLVFLFYVILVGPVNFAFVERRRQPTLALVTTPCLALACMAATFFVGYVGKGVEMRYRRVSLLETAEGSALAISRSYAGLFYSRPTAVDVLLEPGASGLRLGTSGANDGPTALEGRERSTLEGLRAGLWETAFLRSDEILDLGGSFHFELDGDRLAALRNESNLPLRGAFVTDIAGGVYALGEVLPGAQVEIPTTPTSFLAVGDVPTPGQLWSGAHAFLGSLGYDSSARDAIASILSMAVEAPSNGAHPVLFARLDPGPPIASSPAFQPEIDVRLLRLTPRVRQPPLHVPSLAAASEQAPPFTPRAANAGRTP